MKKIMFLLICSMSLQGVTHKSRKLSQSSSVLTRHTEPQERSPEVRAIKAERTVLYEVVNMNRLNCEMIAQQGQCINKLLTENMRSRKEIIELQERLKKYKDGMQKVQTQINHLVLNMTTLQALSTNKSLAEEVSQHMHNQQKCVNEIQEVIGSVSPAFSSDAGRSADVSQDRAE